LKFEWDSDKAETNLAKHGVSFEEATAAFADPLGRIVNDPRHSIGEERFALLGVSPKGKLFAVLYVERGDAVRWISARIATRQERRDYEERTH
jgi:uncharacterized protein